MNTIAVVGSEEDGARASRFLRALVEAFGVPDVPFTIAVRQEGIRINLEGLEWIGPNLSGALAQAEAWLLGHVATKADAAQARAVEALAKQERVAAVLVEALDAAR